MLATREREFLIKQHQEEKTMLLEKIEKLETENKLMTDKLIKNAKDIVKTRSNNSNSNNVPHSNTMWNDKSSGVINNTRKEDNNAYSYKFANNHDDPSINKTKILNHTVTGPNGGRVLTCKMLKEIIDEIYSSKVLFDKICFENKMARETMEQHMYTYLNHKYGLKNLIIEWATSIINGIKAYSSEDSDVFLFGKVNHISSIDS